LPKNDKILSEKVKETPLMGQYNQIKSKHPGALLLFRVGDFYETFGQDAVVASQILNITLTKRANGAAAEIELAGFPHHALDTYLPKLVRAGQRVAVCDQLEDPKMAKGIVKRGVTELVTPGLSYNDAVLETKSNNYLASIHFPDKSNLQIGIAFLDLSTGDFVCSQGNLIYCQKILQSYQPAEVIYCKQAKELFANAFSEYKTTFKLDDWVYHYDSAYESLLTHFKTQNLKGYGVQEFPNGITAAGAILKYLQITEHHHISHITSLSRIEEHAFLWLDKFTIKNLELVQAAAENGTALSEILDKTQTPMGARMLRKWILMPLKDELAINERLQIVAHFFQDEQLLDLLQSILKQIGDLERLISKVALARVSPREMVQIKKALLQTIPLKKSLETSPVEALKRIADNLNPCHYLIEKIENHLIEPAPNNTNGIGYVKDGVDQQLDEYRHISSSAKQILDDICSKEIERTGIQSLKISYNKVFGYYMEVRNLHKDKVPQEWIRKQTLANAERYITEELKILEEKILGAEQAMGSIEQNIYNQLINIALEYVRTIQTNAKIIAQIDCLTNFAFIAKRFKYEQPQIDNSFSLEIKQGRHPVIEQMLPTGEKYVPNDVSLDPENQQIILITGPNMAGKSALLRQTALIVLMAQMGSFVPAESARIGLIDKVFTRVGASDNLSKGESTFMVEMTETASILNNLSDRSLVLMDEIGRGTSTYDGLSIAWAIVEFLHEQVHTKAKTLFATHYHELSELESRFQGVKNFNVSVKESHDSIIFMRKLKPGASNHSFGINVAQMAGMPSKVLQRAHEILASLEKDKSKDNKNKVKQLQQTKFQLHLFDTQDPAYQKICQLLSEVDINAISPVEALMKLNQLKEIIEK